MNHQLRPLFWIEAVLGLASGMLIVMTVLWKDWIEIVFGLDPDAGSGAVEWAVVGLAVLATVTLLTLARAEWRRARTQPT